MRPREELGPVLPARSLSSVRLALVAGRVGRVARQVATVVLVVEGLRALGLT